MMRKLLWLLVVLAWSEQAHADEEPAVKEPVPVSAASAQAYIRQLANGARAREGGPGTAASDWGLRPGAVSERAFGADYEGLSGKQKEVVDNLSWQLLRGCLAPIFRTLIEEGELTSSALENGDRLVVLPNGRRHAVELVIGRNKAAGQLEIVDAGVKGKRSVALLQIAWKKGLARAGPDGDRAAALVSMAAEMAERIKLADRKRESMDNIRSLVTLMLVRVTDKGWKYFRFGGKSFVLGPLASGDIDRTKPDHLAILYSPRVPPSDRAPVEAYQDITREALWEGYDCSKLTSYAGRRNNERSHIVTAAEERRGTIIIADLSFKDVVIAGFSNGSVAELTREQLGLGPDDPIVVGDESKSPMLKKLSLK